MKKYSVKFIVTVAAISILTVGGTAWAAQNPAAERTLKSYLRQLEEILMEIEHKYPGFWKDYDLANEVSNYLEQNGSGALSGSVNLPATPDFGAQKLLEENQTSSWYGAEENKNKNKNENVLPPIPDLIATPENYAPQFTPDASSESGGEQSGQEIGRAHV